MNNNRKKIPQNRKKEFHRHNSYNNNNHNHNHNNYHNGNSNNQQNNNNNNNNSYQPRKPTPSIQSIHEFTPAPIYSPLELTLPYLYPKQPSTHKFNELPSIKQRQPAKISSPLNILQSTFMENLQGINPNREKLESMDPALKIIIQNKKNAKKFKLGTLEIDITKKTNILNNQQQQGPNKLINKFLQNESLSTPLKRNRDEIVDASSSIKKNKRLTEVQQDTSSMELSFEGKAMDKNDYAKLVDDSGLMIDDSILPIDEHQQSNHQQSQQQNTFDTKNLLQNTEFSFEFRK
ncbi:hypothetical protein BN7_5922 [Wickerhamomyces ciferrii]|uniref:Uncharacterized protein n=1 Tax=Wickerhamomyces ciferrii (strain ATCC 14091 / BCRC 22168 / CBS 111 / JCM 3599 / NBRC 0793 / NRRL Y-1031 F-60-10) TaxID=1206466 RepID=K0KY04_WICCF|nr:uncharacterized protein BN7_5922 [Wickerhamomyces ciferrii]CCH46329.1 hypothetical protein BN7_5922 [Wickerhamomyces ciferrii]